MASKIKLTADAYTVGLIYIKLLELKAITVMLDEKHESIPLRLEDDNEYTLGKIGNHNVAIAGPPRGAQGKVAIADVVGRIRLTFKNIRVGLLVGIGGGVPHLPKHDVRLGDVVVGAPEVGPAVVQYDLGKQLPDDIEVTRTLNKPPALLLKVVDKVDNQYYMTEEGEEDLFINHLQRFEKLPRMKDLYRNPSLPDRLFLANYNHEDGTQCSLHDQRYEVERPDRDPPGEIRIHYSTILSGDLVMKSGEKRDEISSKYNNALCFEMEAAGLMDVFPCLVIRGICDYSDSHKNKNWQEYAAATAAAYAREIILTMAERVVEEIKYLRNGASDTDSNPPDPTIMQLLKSLHFREMYDRQNDIKPAADGTCTWLLEHKTLREWLDQKQGLLWIRGNPGTGKSTLLRHALRKINELKPRSLNKVLLASFFFHGRGTELQKTALGLFQSILYQTIDHIREQVPDLLSDLKKSFEKKCEAIGGPGIDWNWHLSELQNILESLFEKLLKSGRYSIRIIVDALDECGEKAAIEIVRGFQRLLRASFTHETRYKNTLGICFSCRHYPALFLDYGPEICVETENKTDITTYVRYELKGNRSRLQDAIIERAGGSFQWASLAVDKVIQLELRGEDRRVISNVIQRTPQNLNELYRELLTDIDPDNRPRSLKLIQWILFATQPLTLDELRFAMVIDADTPYRSLRQCRDAEEYTDDNELMQRRVKHLSCGLAEIRLRDNKRIVQFIHQSVIDFLVLQGGLRLIDRTRMSIDLAIGHAHHRLSRSCIRYMAMEEVGYFERVDRENLGIEFPFVRYAITSWVIHAEQAEAKNISQSDLLDYLRWPSRDLLQRWSRLYRALDPSSKDCPPGGPSLLHVVSRSSLISALRAILEDSFNFNACANSKDDSGWTPLSRAVCKWDEAVVKLLIKKDAVDRNSKDPSFGRTPLLWAVENRNEEVAKMLLAFSDVSVNLEDNYGWTPLLLATRNGDSAMVKLLTEKNANRLGKFGGPKYDQTLLVASERGFNDLVGLLLERDGIELNPKGSNGLTPLWLAVRNRHTGVVKLLIEKEGVDLNFKEPQYGQTPLSWAAEHGYEETVKLLIKKDIVDLNTIDSRYGRTPLLWAARNGHDAVVKLLLEKDGSELNIKDSEYGHTPLSWAAERGYVTIAQLLIRKGGVDLNSVAPWYGQTPLSLAAERGHVRVVAILLETDGVDLDAKDPENRTPLLWAARSGHAEVVRLLLQKGGVNPNCRESKFGRTPLWWAEKNGHKEVRWLLAMNSRSKGE